MSEVIARVLTTSRRSSITHESYAALEPTQPDRASRLKHRGSMEGGPREDSSVQEKQGSRSGCTPKMRRCSPIRRSQEAGSKLIGNQVQHCSELRRTTCSSNARGRNRLIT